MMDELFRERGEPSSPPGVHTGKETHEARNRKMVEMKTNKNKQTSKLLVLGAGVPSSAREQERCPGGN